MRPAAVGGCEAHPGTLTAAVQALAAGDAAAAWCVAVGATSGLLAGYLPEESARAIYAGPATMVGGVFAPRGRAIAEEGGYRVSGRWPFASGCRHCRLADGRLRRRGRRHGADAARTGCPTCGSCSLPADDVHDPRHVARRGAARHRQPRHRARRRARPAERSASVFTDPPVQAGPLYAFPLFGLLALAIASVCLGIAPRRARRPRRDGRRQGRRPAGARTLAERATVQAEVARAEAAVRAARALLDEAIGEAWERGRRRRERRRGAPRGPAPGGDARDRRPARRPPRPRTGSAAAAPIYDSSPLQRRLRDVNAATQHMLVAPATWELTGRLLLGLPTDATQL